MKMEVYTEDEIDRVVGILETVQDGLEVETSDILYDMLEEVIVILSQEDVE